MSLFAPNRVTLQPRPAQTRATKFIFPERSLPFSARFTEPISSPRYLPSAGCPIFSVSRPARLRRRPLRRLSSGRRDFRAGRPERRLLTLRLRHRSSLRPPPSLKRKKGYSARFLVVSLEAARSHQPTRNRIPRRPGWRRLSHEVLDPACCLSSLDFRRVRPSAACWSRWDAPSLRGAASLATDDDSASA